MMYTRTRTIRNLHTQDINAIACEESNSRYTISQFSSAHRVGHSVFFHFFLHIIFYLLIVPFRILQWVTQVTKYHGNEQIIKYLITKRK